MVWFMVWYGVVWCGMVWYDACKFCADDIIEVSPKSKSPDPKSDKGLYPGCMWVFWQETPADSAMFFICTRLPQVPLFIKLLLTHH